MAEGTLPAEAVANSEVAKGTLPAEDDAADSEVVEPAEPATVTPEDDTGIGSGPFSDNIHKYMHHPVIKDQNKIYQEIMCQLQCILIYSNSREQAIFYVYISEYIENIESSDLACIIANQYGLSRFG